MPKKSSAKNQSVQRSGRIASAHGAGKGGSNGSDDDTPVNDNASVISNVSSGSFVRDDFARPDGVNSGDDTAEELSQDMIFEEKLREAMDLASQKSAAGRTSALDAICRAFCKKYVPEFVEDRRVTITDIVERALKKGKGAEVVAGCNLCILLCLQLDSVDLVQEVFKDLKSIFFTLLNDISVTPAARSAIAHTYAMTCFLAVDHGEIEEVMLALEKIFLSNPQAHQLGGVNAELSALTTAAVSSWTLLLTELPYSRSYDYLSNQLNIFEALLDSPDVDLRIAAGEAIVVLYENASEHDEEAAIGTVEQVLPKLEELSKDSHKYRSKKDRKEQKSNFRDFVKTIEDGDTFYEKMVINKREILEIETWSQKKQYDAICRVLGPGMNIHLTENFMIREIFALGAPIPAINTLASTRPSKQERLMANQLSSKRRTQTRGRHRDKRSAVI